MLAKIAKLILFKDKSYLGKEILKEKFKKYSKISDEIRILEDKLLDLNSNDNNKLNSTNEDKYIKEYMTLLNLLKDKLDEINKNNNIKNSDKIYNCIELLKNIQLNDYEDELLKYDILNRIESLKVELDKIQWELEMAILDYAIQTLDIDLSNNEKDMFNYIFNEIEKYLSYNNENNNIDENNNN